MNELTTSMLIGASVLLLLAVFVVILWLRLARLHASHQRMLSQLTQAQQGQEQNQILRAEIAEVRTAVENIASHVQHLQGRTEELAQQQHSFKEADPQAKLYSRAVKMIELGAPLEEVMRECELPLAEAELLFSLHQKN
ncbi:DUF2802 domain-containing protein [Pseudoalteromonas sp. T1lg48]|uniref:DUF2802 domain-containing protein n=1 Tax=Pseudoalteromonas sp. T1lg48 TaxID=2077100 RepID=UPI000CF6342F|nr:DUF2802 domain-containing protein [Pseudoalteromonas sp. T1lg48]